MSLFKNDRRSLGLEVHQSFNVLLFFFRECNQFYCPDDSNVAELDSVMDAALNIRGKVLEQFGQKDLLRMVGIFKIFY